MNRDAFMPDGRGDSPRNGNDGDFNVVYVLPPPELSFEEAASIRLPALPDCHVFLETSALRLREGLALFERWSLTYSATIVWLPHMRGRLAARFVLHGRRGRPAFGPLPDWRPVVAGPRKILDAALAKFALGSRLDLFPLPDDPGEALIAPPCAAAAPGAAGRARPGGAQEPTRGAVRRHPPAGRSRQWQGGWRADMASIDKTLESMMEVNGTLGCAVVDTSTGMALGTIGGGVDLELAAAGNSEVVKAKLQTMKSLRVKGGIEDILITLDKQIHIIRPSRDNEGLFLYVVLDKAKANLALARRKAAEVEAGLSV